MNPRNKGLWGGQDGYACTHIMVFGIADQYPGDICYEIALA
jgi:hypothetical protein